MSENGEVRSRSPVRFHRKAVLRLSYTIWRIIRAGARADANYYRDAQTLESAAVTGVPAGGVAFGGRDSKKRTTTVLWYRRRAKR